jgi:hypothetical protein
MSKSPEEIRPFRFWENVKDYSVPCQSNLVFSLPEHNVVIVSYCDDPCPSSCVVCRQQHFILNLMANCNQTLHKITLGHCLQRSQEIAHQNTEKVYFLFQRISPSKLNFQTKQFCEAKYVRMYVWFKALFFCYFFH